MLNFHQKASVNIGLLSARCLLHAGAYFEEMEWRIVDDSARGGAPGGRGMPRMGVARHAIGVGQFGEAVVRIVDLFSYELNKHSALSLLP